MKLQAWCNLIACAVVSGAVSLAAHWIGPRPPASQRPETHTADLTAMLPAAANDAPTPPPVPARQSSVEVWNGREFEPAGQVQPVNDPAPAVLPLIKQQPDIVIDLFQVDTVPVQLVSNPGPPVVRSEPPAMPNAALPIRSFKPSKPVVACQLAAVPQQQPTVCQQYRPVQRTYYRQGLFGRRWGR